MRKEPLDADAAAVGNDTGRSEMLPASIIKQIQAEAGRYLAYLHSAKPLNDEFRMIKGRIVTLACQLANAEVNWPVGSATPVSNAEHSAPTRRSVAQKRTRTVSPE